MPNYCPHCEAEQIEGSKFCSTCGKKIKQQVETKTKPQPQQEEQNPAFVPLPTKKKVSKKWIIGVAAIIIAVIILIVILLFQGGTNPLHTSDSRFVGEWEQNIIGDPLLWKFNNDGTLEVESFSERTWTVIGTQLCLNNTFCYTYTFSNNENTITMNRTGEMDIVLIKKGQQGTSQTPNIKCIVNSSANRLIITSIDENVKWSDIAITTNPVASWQVQDVNRNQLAKIGYTSTIVRYVTVSDNILLLETVGNIAVNLTFVPTNALLGTWTVNV